MSLQRRLEDELQALRQAIAATGALLVSPEGFILAASTDPDAATYDLAAIAACVVGLGRRAAATLQAGDLHEAHLSSEQAEILMYTIDLAAILVVLAPQRANRVLISLEARRRATALREALANVRGGAPFPLVASPGSRSDM